jgi:polysaccharide pyruvyl transferase WcaK-like protein
VSRDPFPVVVLDNGDHKHVSRGDGAMLTATIDRIRSFWPAAWIGVVSSSPTRLRLVDPTVTPLPEDGLDRWKIAPARNGHAMSIPTWALDLWWTATERWAVSHRARRAITRVARRLPRSLLGARGGSPSAPLRPDLTIAVGGGYLCDMDASQAIEALGTLEWAALQGSATALVSQGVGPVAHGELRARMSEVLPTVDLILLRERLLGPQLLAELGVPAHKVSVTGDDAIFLASKEPMDLAARSRIGVSLRSAAYLEFEGPDRGSLLTAIADAAKRLGASVRPVTACEWRDEDRLPNRALASQVDRFEPDLRRSASPRDFADAFRACRVVVTTTYHAAVFALSQGVPAVGMYRSEYQLSKFAGLADLFGGEAMTIVDLREAAERASMADKIVAAWNSADSVATSLTGKAEGIRRNLLGGYDRIARLVADRSVPAARSAARDRSTDADRVLSRSLRR